MYEDSDLFHGKHNSGRVRIVEIGPEAWLLYYLGEVIGIADSIDGLETLFANRSPIPRERNPLRKRRFRGTDGWA